MAKKKAEKQIVQCGVYNVQSHWVLICQPPTELLVEAEIWVKYDDDTKADLFMNYSVLDGDGFAVTDQSFFDDEAWGAAAKKKAEVIASYESARAAYASPYGRAAKVLKKVYSLINDARFEE